MRRPTALGVDTEAAEAMTPDDSTISFAPESSSQALNEHLTTPPTEYSPPAPSFKLLFSLLSRRDLLLFLLPAVIFSMIAGAIAPFMTLVVGNVFNTFAQFATTSAPSQEAKATLLHGVGISALELVGLSAGALILSSLTSWLWILTGERNTRILRKRVYESVAGREMTWFDLKMGSEGSVQTTEGDGPVGAGGLMAKFARETEEVRMGSSLACGMVVQHLTTTVTCLCLGFDRSWSLTLVILSSVPATLLVHAVCGNLVSPFHAAEVKQDAVAATLVDRAISAIATVKAFNAQSHEVSTVSATFDKMRAAARKCFTIWGIQTGLSQFVNFAMFVQGFWFGGKLVREGKVQAGDVMAVFWACLIAATNMTMAMPHFLTLGKGKLAMSTMISLIESPSPAPPQPSSPDGTRRPSLVSLPSAKGKRQAKPVDFRMIAPFKCQGQIDLESVWFSYPSRPNDPVLRDVTMFLPAGEMTFIVGGSGSGKSTLAQLLQRMYDPQQGKIMLDRNELDYLDPNWTRQQIGSVSQGCILFDMSVHDNVAMGLEGPMSFRRRQDVSREEVVDACTLALMHDFVRNLPDGYDTMLGTGGANLSGGQKQRLAIARAKLRDPTILILDEATSALDATSRILVFEAIKHWRRNKTTIVITHDLSQIGSDDFAFVMKDGQVAQQGYRSQLEADVSGEFFAMMGAQAAGGVPEKEDPYSVERMRAHEEEAIQIVQQEEGQIEGDLEKVTGNRTIKHRSGLRTSMAAGPRASLWMFDAVADLTGHGSSTTDLPTYGNRFIPIEEFNGLSDPFADRPRRPSTVAIEVLPPPPSYHPLRHQYSLQFSPLSPTAPSLTSTVCEDEPEFDEFKTVAVHASNAVQSRRGPYHRSRPSLDKEAAHGHIESIHMEKLKKGVAQKSQDHPAKQESSAPPAKQTGFWRLIREVFPTIPNKFGLLIGALFCAVGGATTPVFSFVISRLMVEVSTGATDVNAVNMYGGIALAIAATDGIAAGGRFFTLESVGMSWITRIRKFCFSYVLAQDKKWFDKSENSPARIMQILVKDGDDARSLIATVFSQAIMVVTMLSVGLLWAFVIGWQLTLVGLAIAPVFVITMAVQANLVARCEYRNKRAREDVAKGYYDTILNIRGIRAMGLERVFLERFNASVETALSTGARGAFVEGCTYGVASSLIYLSEAVLFYVSAIFVAKGLYNYLQMVQTLNLVIFTVSIGSQLMAFTQRIAKSMNATRDFNRLLHLSTQTAESRGAMRPPIEGDISFHDVSFSYPERPDAPVLKQIDLDIHDGETVAIVGSSGSGKSTIAALLQRLYEPATGSISIGPWHLGSTEVTHLRDHVAVVSQNPHLFDASVKENIAYGAANATLEDVQRAAREANVHDFIMSLPQGYDTMLGENASLISGGQAQRLQIARALVRPSKILILDECTSALDGANQAAVMRTMMSAKEGRTTLMVTHKLAVMQMCSRIIVLHEGRIAEEGTYEDLMARKGVFEQLASGGEWSGE